MYAYLSKHQDVNDFTFLEFLANDFFLVFFGFLIMGGAIFELLRLFGLF